MIDPADIALVKRCLEAYYASCSQILPVVPADMRRGQWQESDWVDWKLIPSRLKEADVAALEARLPFGLPPLFRAHLVTYFVLDMDFGEFRLPALPSDAPLNNVQRYLVQPELCRSGRRTGPTGDG
jgi:hypothetical protein